MPGRGKLGLKYLLHPDDPGVLPLRGWHGLSDYQLCFWYALEIERRQEAYAARLVQAGGRSEDVTAEELPDPVDSAVHTRRVPAETAAALRFSGRWSRGSFEKRVAQLLAALDAAGLEVGGAPRYARFDPPWTPWFLRRNEVVVPLLL